MKIGIMGAMLEEVESIKHTMDVSNAETFAFREYTIGKLNKIDTVLVFSRWGKVAASSTATTLISRYNVDAIIFVGVAGALEQSLNVGDIVIGEALYQHDMDARPLFDKHEVPLTNKKISRAHAELVKNANSAACLFLSNLENNMTLPTLAKFSIHQPKVVNGKIASGDQFVSHPLKIDELKKDVPDVFAVEMEGAAVAQVCEEHDIPFVIIRTISDKAGHDAAIDFQAFINEVAREYSAGIIAEIFKSGIMAV